MKTTIKKTQNKLAAFLTALMLLTVIATAAIPASAQGSKPLLTIANLAGTWTVAIYSNGACGNGTHILIFTLNSSGVSGNFADTYNSSACGQGQHPDQTFTIDSMDPAGFGTATFSNNKTPLTFNFQVNPAGNFFNMVDVTDAGSYWMGTAIKH
jgi:hypothetical protein